MKQRLGWYVVGILVLAGAGPATEPGAWPSDAKGLVFCFETNNFKTPIQAWDGQGNALLAFLFKARDDAHYDRNYALAVTGGSFVAEGAEDYVVGQCRKSGAFTLEAWVAPREKSTGQLGQIVWLGGADGGRDLALGQEGDKLVLFVKTSAGQNEGELLKIEDERPFHIAVTYSAGKVAGYKDGKEVRVSGSIAGDLGNWEAGQLVFGADGKGAENWAGALEGVALYSRALTGAEVAADAAAYGRRVGERTVPTVLKVKGTLLAKSEPGDVKDLGTYSRAVVVYEYAVDQVISGKYAEKKIRVAHWGIMDRKPLPGMIGRAVGKQYTLILEPWEENPQMDSELQRDELPVSDLPLWYDAVAPG